MGPTGSPKISVKNYHYALCNTPEECRAYLNLISGKITFDSVSCANKGTPQTCVFVLLPNFEAFSGKDCPKQWQHPVALHT
jgi:hypothetical protein